MNPLGIDTAAPALSWQSDDAAANWLQSAYRVEIATSLPLLRASHADVWDSGQVRSSESVGIAYAGAALKPRTRYYWRVHTWDKTGNEQTSTEMAWWETGLLRPQEWRGKWISYTDATETETLRKVRWLWLPNADATNVPSEQPAEFRLLLHLDHKPQAAVLHCLAGGVFTAAVNGKVTGRKEDWASFDREEVLPDLKAGKGAAGDNEIVVTTRARRADTGSVNPSGFAAVLTMRDSNGSPVTVVSDAAWQTRASKADSWQPVQVIGDLQAHKASTGSDRKILVAAPDRIDTEVSLLRREFTAPSNVQKARLYITALGAYRATLNGKRVSPDLLTPGFTDFHKRVLYQTYDVTTLVQKGRNAFGIQLGGGWHSSPLLWAGLREFAGPDAVRADLVLTMRDGATRTISTDQSWSATRDATASSEIYGGESYDARLTKAGWDRAPFASTGGWVPVTSVPEPGGLVISAEGDLPPHTAEVLKPTGVTDVPSGSGTGRSKLFDMGQNMVGVVRLRVRGERGTIVRLRFAERLQPDGSVYTENLRNADQTDEYTLRGGGWEEWTPAFTFHGFRYVQVDGLTAGAGPETITGEVINSLPPQPSMQFSSSNSVLNSMFRLGLWGQRGNFVSVPTDCPQRDERMGWMGDAGVFWRTGSYNFDIDPFTHKFMNDVTDAQDDRGVFANISPNLLRVGPESTGAPGWGDAGVLVPYATWQQYGDRSVINENWDAMERWMKFIADANPDGRRTRDLGPNYADWLAPDPNTPRDLVATAYWALIAQQMADMARATNRPQAAERYEALYHRIRTAYRKAYLGSKGEVLGNTQTAYVLTLYTGLADDHEKSEMTERLVADIQKHGNHLTTGFLGTPFLLFVLDREGRSDVAYTLLLNETYPSWGYMVQKGATTWWERWNGDTGDPGMNSYNHYAFGSVMNWVYSRVSGIATDAKHPGFQHMIIAPAADARLPHAQSRFESVYGPVQTDWTRNADGSFALSVDLPANTTATVKLPAGPTARYLQNGVPVQGAAVEIGSGRTVFVSQ